MNNFESYLNLYKNNEISLRQLCFYANKYSDEVISLTIFLNNYDNVTINERLYYIINNIQEVIKCKYCNNKASWTGRITDGYYEICSNKECRKKQLSDAHTDNTKISENRDKKFIKIQNEIKKVNDKIIKKIFKYDKYVDLITNEIIITYLKNRYTDSDSLLETVQRIRLDIEEKPKCPTCGKPVKWIGKKSKMFTTYCSDKCSAININTTAKKKATLLEHWGTENCYDSEKYKQFHKEKYGVEYQFQRSDIKEKRDKTLLDKYGTNVLYKIDGVLDKVRQTNLERYGYDYIFQVPEIRLKAYKALTVNQKLGTSKMEQQIYEYFLELGYKPERFVVSEKYHNGHAVADFYLKEYDLYIEYQGSQYHHGSAFFGTETDLIELNRLQEKDHEFRDKQIFENQYAGMINTLVKVDVCKRCEAYKNGINLLEIYSCRNVNDLKKQIDLYLAAKTGITNDKEVEKLIKNSKYALYFKLYSDNPIIRRFIIQDAVNKLNKNENDLTINEIMESFKNNEKTFKK